MPTVQHTENVLKQQNGNVPLATKACQCEFHTGRERTAANKGNTQNSCRTQREISFTETKNLSFARSENTSCSWYQVAGWGFDTVFKESAHLGACVMKVAILSPESCVPPLQHATCPLLSNRKVAEVLGIPYHGQHQEMFLVYPTVAETKQKTRPQPTYHIYTKQNSNATRGTVSKWREARACQTSRTARWLRGTRPTRLPPPRVPPSCPRGCPQLLQERCRLRRTAQGAAEISSTVHCPHALKRSLQPSCRWGEGDEAGPGLPFVIQQG